MLFWDSQSSYRDTGGKVGKTIGRNVYFTKIDLNTLGYSIDEKKLDPDGVIEMGDGWSLWHKNKLGHLQGQ